MNTVITTTVSIYHNESGQFREYKPGDPLTRVVSIDLPGALSADAIFGALQSEDWSTDDAMFKLQVAYYQMHCRSLSVGDLVAIGDLTCAVSDRGWCLVSFSSIGIDPELNVIVDLA